MPRSRSGRHERGDPAIDTGRLDRAGSEGRATTPEKGVFTQIYDTGAWSNGSGSGSHPDNTSLYRAFLQRFLADHAVATVVDLGCGDWQSSRLVDWSGIRYLGLDLVDSVIRHNVARYQTGTVRFGVLSSLGDDLPAADLLIVKDVLQHWPNDAIHALRPRLSAYRHTLITNTREPARPDGSRPTAEKLNRDVRWGGHRPVDLSQPPFEWPVREVLRHASRRRGETAAEVKVTVLLAAGGAPREEIGWIAP